MLVRVKPRMWSGMNDLGGVGHITRIHDNSHVDVKYVSGNRLARRADKTIKSRPWRCKYKQQQNRFALMEDAVEHYYRQSQKDNKKLDVKTI